jgi:hypothetical protein
MSSSKDIANGLLSKAYGYDLKELASNATLLEYVQAKTNVSSTTILWELGKLALSTNSKEKLLAASHIIPQNVKDTFIATGSIAVSIYIFIISLLVLKWICSCCCHLCCCEFKWPCTSGNKKNSINNKKRSGTSRYETKTTKTNKNKRVSKDNSKDQSK